MSTISVTVEQTNQALMLAEWLKNIRFVQEVTIDVNKPAKGNAEAIQKILDSFLEKRKKLDKALDKYLIDLSGFKFNRDEANNYE